MYQVCLWDDDGMIILMSNEHQAESLLMVSERRDVLTCYFFLRAFTINTYSLKKQTNRIVSETTEWETQPPYVVSGS